MSINDFRYSARSLRKNPVFASLSILTIALGIGANTSIFTAVNGVLLKTFSFPEAERLVVVNGVSKSQPDVAVSYPDYLDWRAGQRTFVDLGAYVPAGGIISGQLAHRSNRRTLSARVSCGLTQYTLPGANNSLVIRDFDS